MPSLFPPKVMAMHPPIYPQHPFNPTLSALISPLPSAIREIALARILNTHLLDAVVAVHRWTRTLDKGVTGQGHTVSEADRDFVANFNSIDVADDLLVILSSIKEHGPTARVTGITHVDNNNNRHRRRSSTTSPLSRLLEHSMTLALLLFVFDKPKSPLMQGCRSYPGFRAELTHLLPHVVEAHRNECNSSGGDGEACNASLSPSALRFARSNALIWMHLVCASAWKVTSMGGVFMPEGREVARALLGEWPEATRWEWVVERVKDSCLWFGPGALEWKSCLELVRVEAVVGEEEKERE